MTSDQILNHPIISQRYFFPRRGMDAQPFWVDCDEARLACYYHEVDVTAPTVVHFHGNGEIVSDYLDGFPELIGRMGCNCFLAEFRGYGGSTGRPQLGKMLQDVLPTISALDRPQHKLVLFGRSVGSLFAIKAAELFPDVAGLILESAIANPLERLLLRLHPNEIGATGEALESAVHDAIDIKGILSRFAQPTLILHTRHDGLIDVSHAEKLAQWCTGPTHLNIFQQGTHNDIMFVNSQQYFGLVSDFLATLWD